VLPLGSASRLKLIVQASGDMSGRSRGVGYLTSSENHPNILRELYERMTAEKRRRGPVWRAKNVARGSQAAIDHVRRCNGPGVANRGPQQLCDGCFGACGVAAS